MAILEQILNLGAWPVAVVILGLAWIFREPLGGLIKRTRRIGPSGLEADGQPRSRHGARACYARRDHDRRARREAAELSRMWGWEVRSREELHERLKTVPADVPARGQGRKSEHVERYVIRDVVWTV